MKGRACESNTNVIAKLCDVGYECSDPANPTKCQSGTRANETGLTECLDCPEGHNCFDPISPFKCGPGTYALHSAENACSTCIAGHFCIDGIIRPCGSGRYASIGSYKCNDCKPGEKCIEEAQDEPGSCPIGTGYCRLLFPKDTMYTILLDPVKDTLVVIQLSHFYAKLEPLQIC